MEWSPDLNEKGGRRKQLPTNVYLSVFPDCGRSIRSHFTLLWPCFPTEMDSDF